MKRRRTALKDLFKTPVQKTYGLLVASVITVAFFFTLAIRPAYVKIGELNKEIAQYKTLKTQMDLKRNTIVDLNRQRDDNATEMNNFNIAFPDEINTGFLIANLDGLAERNNVVLTSIEFSNDLDRTIADAYAEFIHTGSISTTQIELSVEGDLKNILTFSSSLESFPRPLDVISIGYQFNSVTDTTAEGESAGNIQPYRANFVIVTFFANTESINEAITSETGIVTDNSL